MKIDDEADSAGIKFVKIDDIQLGKNLGVFALPALVFFKKGEEEEPIIYAGIPIIAQCFHALILLIKSKVI